MVPAFDLMSCPNLAVPAEVMQHVAQVESSTNPFAIGVVGGRLERQPRNLGEAIATARMLQTQGYNYSLGIAQVNRSNLVRYGLDTYEKAFDGCANLAAGARILAECYGRSGGDWGKAFSCYYSGNFVTGYREGYVQRIYDSINASVADAAKPITVYPATSEHPAGTAKSTRATVPGSRAYRVAIRSVALNAQVARLVSPLNGPANPASEAHAAERPLEPARGNAQEAIVRHPERPFHPRVSGPNDPPNALAAASAANAHAPVPGIASQSLPRQEGADAAFVF